MLLIYDILINYKNFKKISLKLKVILLKKSKKILLTQCH